MQTRQQELPLVSIIIPVYNAEPYIRRCLDSAARQTYKNIELIVVDDGSTDASAAICDEYAQSDKRIKVIHKANGGLVSARKAGIIQAAGQYTAYLDDDDWIEPHMYEDLVREITKHRADIVTSGLYREYNGLTVQEHDYVPEGAYGRKEIEHNIMPVCMDWGDFYKAGINMHLYNKLFKRELLVRNQRNTDDIVTWGEDGAVVYPCVLEAEKIVITHRCYYHYCIRQNSNSMAWAGSQRDLKGYRAVYQVIRNAIENHKKQKDVLTAQLNSLMLYLLLIKEPQLIIREKQGILFPFSNIRAGEQVILYGGGRFGCALYRFLSETRLCPVVLWVDRCENRKKGIAGSRKLKEAKDLRFDKIIISVLDGKAADEIYEELLMIPIEKDKIARADCRVSGNELLGILE